MLLDETVIVAVSDQTSVDLDDEAAILHLGTGIYFGLNEVGAFVWRRLQQPCTVSALRAALLAEYDVSPDQAAADHQLDVVHAMADLLANRPDDLPGAIGAIDVPEVTAVAAGGCDRSSADRHARSNVQARLEGPLPGEIDPGLAGGGAD